MGQSGHIENGINSDYDFSMNGINSDWSVTIINIVLIVILDIMIIVIVSENGKPTDKGINRG